MYAIRHKKTKKWVYGTDFRMKHPRMSKREISGKNYSHEQRTSFHKALLFGDLIEAQVEFEYRACGRQYEIVEVWLYAKNDPMIGEWKKIDDSAVKGEE